MDPSLPRSLVLWLRLLHRVVILIADQPLRHSITDGRSSLRTWLVISVAFVSCLTPVDLLHCFLRTLCDKPSAIPRSSVSPNVNVAPDQSEPELLWTHSGSVPSFLYCSNWICCDLAVPSFRAQQTASVGLTMLWIFTTLSSLLSVLWWIGTTLSAPVWILTFLPTHWSELLSTVDHASSLPRSCPLVRAFIATADKRSSVSPVWPVVPVELSMSRATFSFSGFSFIHHTTVWRLRSTSERLSSSTITIVGFHATPDPERPFVIHVHLRGLTACRGGTFVYGPVLPFSTSRSHVCDSHESGSHYYALVWPGVSWSADTARPIPHGERLTGQRNEGVSPVFLRQALMLLPQAPGSQPLVLPPASTYCAAPLVISTRGL